MGHIFILSYAPLCIKVAVFGYKNGVEIVNYLPDLHPYCLKINRVLYNILLYGLLKGFYKILISCEVIVLAILTLHQALFGYKNGV